MLLLERLGRGQQLARVGKESLRDPAGTPVVQHVAPEKGLFVVALPHLEGEPRENVSLGQDLLSPNGNQRILELGERIAQLGQQSTGQVIENLPGLVEDG